MSARIGDTMYVCDGASVAVLSGLRLLCRKCHLAKHVGFAGLMGRRGF